MLRIKTVTCLIVASTLMVLSIYGSRPSFAKQPKKSTSSMSGSAIRSINVIGDSNIKCMKYASWKDFKIILDSYDISKLSPDNNLRVYLQFIDKDTGSKNFTDSKYSLALMFIKKFDRKDKEKAATDEEIQENVVGMYLIDSACFKDSYIRADEIINFGADHCKIILNNRCYSSNNIIQQTIIGFPYNKIHLAINESRIRSEIGNILYICETDDGIQGPYKKEMSFVTMKFGSSCVRSSELGTGGWVQIIPQGATEGETSQLVTPSSVSFVIPKGKATIKGGALSGSSGQGITRKHSWDFQRMITSNKELVELDCR